MRTYGKLRETIRNVFGTVGAFAAALNKDRSTVSKKLNGIVPWDQPEMEKSCELLGIPVENLHEYFFYEM